LLALSSNIGHFSQPRFSAVPELAPKAGYQLAPQWQIVAGSTARSSECLSIKITP